jgi:hypothetical protein
MDDTGLTPGTTYYYALYTHDVPINYSSATMGNSTVANGGTTPDNIQNLAATFEVLGMQRNIRLTWTWPAGDVPAGIMIVRNSGADVSGEPVDGAVYAPGEDLNVGTVVAHITDTGTTAYTDTNLPGGITYYYTIFAYDDADFTYTNTGDGAGKEPVSVSLDLPTVLTQITNLVATGQTIDTESVPTAVLGFNLQDAGGAALTSITVRLQSVAGAATTDLTGILAGSSASGVAIYRDNGSTQGVFDSGDTLLPLATAPTWSGSGPWTLVMNLASGLVVPTNDTGANVGDDVYVVIRTSATASNGDKLQFSVPSTNGVMYSNGPASVTGVSTTELTVTMPLRLRDLIGGAGTTISAAGPTVGVIGFDVADGIGQSQTMNSLIATIQNVGGDSDVTPIDFATYSALDQVGALSLWRDARSPAPSTLAANLDGSALSLTLGDGTNYPNSGILIVGREVITYTAKIGNALTIQRGAYGTTPAAHLAGEDVQLAYADLTTLTGNPGAGDAVIDVAGAGRLIDPNGRFLAYVRVNNEIIGYRDISGTQLTGCVRSAGGSAPDGHSAGDTVENAYTALLAGPITNSSTTINVLGRPFEPMVPATELALTIGSEVIMYTGATDQGAGIWQLTGVSRGAEGTLPTAHSNQDLVVFGQIGRFDDSVDSYVFLAALPTQTMAQNINFENMPLSARLDDIDDFFLGATTSSFINNGEDFTVAIDSGEVFFSNSIVTGKSVTCGVVTVTASASTVVLSDVGSTPAAAPGDTITFTFERPVDPATILPANTGNTNSGFAAGSGSITGTLAGLIGELGSFSDAGTISASACTLTMSSDQRRLVITLGPASWPVGNYVEPNGTFTPDPTVLDTTGAPFGGAFTVSGTFGVQDSDRDGLPDWWENLYPTAGNPNADTDGDGLSNLYEYWSGTNPTVADTDGNGTPDGDEDTDGDGLSNSEEERFETRPDIRDTDDDGSIDGMEVDPKNPLYSMSGPTAAPRALDLSRVAAAGISVPQSGRFASSGDSLTFEAWVMLGADDTGTIAKYTNIGPAKTVLELGIDSSAPFARFETATGTEYIAGGATTGLTIPSGKWTHLAAVWSRPNMSLSLYVNGAIEVSQHSVELPAGGVGNMVLAAGFSDGFIDEVRLWGGHNNVAARTQAQIQAAMNENIQEGTTYLLAYYRFDDGGLTIEDFGSHLVGAVWTASMGDATYVLDSSLEPAMSQDNDGDLHADWVTVPRTARIRRICRRRHRQR